MNSLKYKNGTRGACILAVIKSQIQEGVLFV